MRTRQVAIADLEPYPGNPRTHDVAAIKRSLEVNGQYRAIVVRAPRTILAGHGTVEAARELGFTKMLAHIVECSDEEAQRIVLADNRTNDLAGYDDALLQQLLQSVPDLDGTGFTDEDLRALAGERDVRQDDTPPTEPPERATTKAGDLIELGEHRLLCGDAREPDTYARALAGAMPDLPLTDPPYGVGIGAKNRALDEIDKGGCVTSDIEGDQGEHEARELWREAFAAIAAIAAILAPGTPYYVFAPSTGLGHLLVVLGEVGLDGRHLLIWAKNWPTFSMGRLDYEYQHEPIIYGWKPGAAHGWYADGPRSSLLAFDHPMRSSEHPTMKPVPLLGHLIENSTRRDETVLDPFAGSGSTLIAAENLGRRCVAVEISEHYCDVIVDRYERHTGKCAKRPL